MGKVRVETGEVVIFARDSGGSSWPSMEDFSIDPLRGVHTSLDHRDTSTEDVADVGAGLGATPPIKVADRVVVGVGNVVLRLVTLDDAAGILLIITFFQGIFYHRDATKQ